MDMRIIVSERLDVFYVPNDDVNFSLMAATYSTIVSRYGAFNGRDQYTVIHVVPESDFIFRTTAAAHNNETQHVHIYNLKFLFAEIKIADKNTAH